MSNALFQFLLRLGDDSLILGQRLCEWSGRAPTVEVDLSLSNLALDLMGQATYFLNYAGEVEGAGRNGDRLAFHRDAEEFRNCLLVEQPNGDFGQTMARQLIFSTYQLLLFEELAGSADVRIAEVAAKAAMEVRYHKDLAADWVIRLGDGTAQSHDLMQEGLDWFWRFLDELFQMDDTEAELVAQGIAIDRSILRTEFDRQLSVVLARATLEAKPAGWALTGGRNGKHSEHLSPMLAEMQVIPRAHPQAKW